MTTRVQKAIDIFLDAINNGTLAKGSCYCCAVGNSVSKGLGSKPVIRDGEPSVEGRINAYWSQLFVTRNNKQHYNPIYLKEDFVMGNIKATDFSVKELMKIEKTFEAEAKIDIQEYCDFTKEAIRADQIKGLEAVVKVMLEFENEVDDVKEVFTKRAELIPV